jgi:hypothetical protein
MARRCFALGGLACGLALLAAACGGSSGSGAGPFGPPDGPGAVCGGTPKGGVLAYGPEEFVNKGSTAVIQRVYLVDPDHLRMLAAWAVPITGTNLYGVESGYPPLPGLAPGIDWAHRQAAKGAVIPHSGGHDVINMVLVVKPSGKEGTAKAFAIAYRVGAAHYLLTERIFLEVPNGGLCPATVKATD